MILIEIQENTIKCKTILKKFEKAKFYKGFKALNIIPSHYEEQIRDLSDESVKLSNSIITEDLSLIKALANNKGLILSLDLKYFNQIISAVSKNSLVQVIPNLNFNIPNTAMNAMEQDKEIINVLKSINTKVDQYSRKINKFRQDYNKIKVNLYYLPKMKDLPNVLSPVGSIANLFPGNNQGNNPPPLGQGINPPTQPTPNTPKNIGAPKQQQKNKKKSSTNNSNQINNIINQF